MGVVKSQAVKRGEIWLTRLDPTVGNEIQKTRPCLVVSPDLINRHLGNVIVMPMTSASWAEPFRIQTEHDGKAGFLLGDQIRSVSKRRLMRLLANAERATLMDALGVLREMFEE